MEKVWDKIHEDYVETPPVMQAFLADLEAVCRKHNLCIGHEDPQGSFDVRALTEADLRILTGADKNFSLRIIRNRARCRKCGSIIESTSVHDRQTCACGAITVDGGREYTKRVAKDLNDIEDLTEFTV